MCKILDDVRKALEKCKMSRYAIAKKTGVSQTALSLFVNGRRGLGFKAMEKVCDCIGYDIVLRPKKKSR